MYDWKCPEGCPGLPWYEKGHWGDPAFLKGYECPDDLYCDEPCSTGIIFEKGENSSMPVKKKSGLNARYQRSYETRDSGMSNPAFDFRKLEREVTFFKPKEGKNRINFVPYEITSKNHPLVKAGEMQIGDLDYVMDYYVHKNIGPSSADIICLKKNYNKPCPICEAMEEVKKKGKSDDVDLLKPKRRVLYNVVDLSKSDNSTVQVFDASQFNFDKEMIEEAKAASDDQNMIDFADPDTGRTVIFRASPKKFEGREFFEFKSFQFVERDEEVTQEMLDDAVSFDEIMKVYSYERIQEILYGKDDDSNGDNERMVEKEEPLAKDLDDEPETTPPPEKDDKKGKDKAKGKDKEKEPPFEGGKTPDKSKETKAKPEKADSKCPHGYKYHEDNDKYDACDKCNLWSQCAKG